MPRKSSTPPDKLTLASDNPELAEALKAEEEAAVARDKEAQEVLAADEGAIMPDVEEFVKETEDEEGKEGKTLELVDRRDIDEKDIAEQLNEDVVHKDAESVRIELPPVPERRAGGQRRRNNEQNQSRLATEAMLRAAVRQGHIFTGEVHMVELIESRDQDGEPIYEVAASVLMERYLKIVIPFNELFISNPLNLSTVDERTTHGRHLYRARKRSFVSKMLGSEIEFCITQVFPSEDGLYTLLGSRAKAMRQIRQRCFLGDNPVFQVGDVVNARVTAVGVHGLNACVGGVDCSIPQFRLSMRWMADVHEHYAVKDSIPMVIRDIRAAKDPNSDIPNVVLRVDPIACELEEAKRYNRLITDESDVLGYITNIWTPSGTSRISIHAWLHGVQLPARILGLRPSDLGSLVKPGDEIKLRVKSHEPSGVLLCAPIGLTGNNAMFIPTKPHSFEIGRFSRR